ncbi:hypothetical protein ACRS5S_18710 [Nocardia asiatica]|uniref:hypothetical protein n=1 Tax=Nocardia asiatica TaxID=209252 RepID=UPI002455B397|nr:hypothetical protein [Nocardia asiatica]
MPESSAAELAASTSAAGGAGVDLRAGKGHGWERHGIDEGVAAVLAAGLSIYFLGSGVRLGERELHWDSIRPAIAVPIKVFCVAEPDPALVAAQCAAAAEQGIELLVEAHEGGPDVVRLTELAEHTGVGVVLDLLGLARIGGASRTQLRELAPHVRAVQVKGFEPPENGWRHRPLQSSDLDQVRQIVADGAPVRAITVESRAGTPRQDLAVVEQLRAEVCR